MRLNTLRNLRQKSHVKRSNPSRGRAAPISLVAFIDLLGFSERVLRAASAKEIRAIKDSVESVRREFEHRPGDQTRSAHRAASKRVLAFSDSIVVSLGGSSKMTDMMGSYDAWGGELVGMAYAQLECVMQGIFLSGGLDVGPWYYKNDVLISPAMIGAYKLQEKFRQPVVALSERLQNFFRNHPDRQRDAPGAEPSDSEFRSLEDDSGNSICFIDYLEICLSDIDFRADPGISRAYRAARTEEEKDDIAKKGYTRARELLLAQHAKVVEAGYKSCPTRARRKYKFLEKYHNIAVDQWFPSGSQLRLALDH